MTSDRLLTTLRVSLHVLVAVLLVIGLVGVGRRSWLAITVAAAFAGVYLVGTVRNNRGYVHTAAQAAGWLAIVIALWVGLAAISPGFVWLEFPLVMLTCFLLPAGWGLAVTAGLLIYTLWITIPLNGVGGLIGPSIGTVLAIGIVHAYQALRGEAEHYQQVAADLKAAQRELVAAERAAGVAQERSRLSREVHDTMAQGLSSIVLLGRALDKELATTGTSESAREILGTIQQTAAENLAEARRFVASNADDAQAPLHDRIARLARAAEARQRALGASLEVRVDVVDLPGPAAAVAERMIREGLSNVVRHSGASVAVVTVNRLGAQATVDIYDNGRGITGPEGFGLKGLRARVEEIGGTLSVEGNVLAATLPLEGP